jgi:hypothetical protein
MLHIFDRCFASLLLTEDFASPLPTEELLALIFVSDFFHILSSYLMNRFLWPNRVGKL